MTQSQAPFSHGPAAAPWQVAATIEATFPANPPVFGAHTSEAAPSAAYQFVRAAPAVAADEVELSHVDALEVLICWGHNVVHVAHLVKARDFWVGESTNASQVADYLIPAEKLGQSALPLIVNESGRMRALIPAAAEGYLETADNSRVALSELRARTEPTPRAAGAHLLDLPAGAKLRLELADLTIQISAVCAGKPVPRGAGTIVDKTVASYFGLSFVAHAALMSALGWFTPALGLNDSEALDRERFYMMQQYLTSSAEREQEQQQQQAAENAELEGGTGERAAGDEGAMGTPTTRVTNHRYAVKGPKENPDPHLARAAALREAVDFGMIGLLNSGVAGDPKAPVSPFGRDTSLGVDDESARGNMWGDSIGEAFGTGGLGLTGLGESGGGRGVGVGMGEIGTVGHGAGLGTGDGFGNGAGFGASRGLSKGNHTARAPRVRPGTVNVSGRLPPEVIQRVVRQNYGRFRLCYEQGLTRNPNLEGRVSARFVISRDGAVANVANGGSDMPDSGVVSCVVSAFYGLSFPAPEGGIVSVVYPIAFTPG